MARRKRFNSEKAALSFAKKVGGKVNDLRKIKEAKCSFTVTYQPSEKTKAHGQISERDWCPEEDRDFGYSNDFWQ